MKLCEETSQSIYKIQPFISGNPRKYLQIGFENQISLAHWQVPRGVDISVSGFWPLNPFDHLHCVFLPRLLYFGEIK